jgi:hypothetical protein
MKLDLLRGDHMLAGRWSVDEVTTDSPISKAGIEIKDVLMKIAREDVSIVNPSLAEVEAKLKKVILLQSFQTESCAPDFPVDFLVCRRSRLAIRLICNSIESTWVVF